MTILETLILGIIQGLTEFIPVSSSGHLVILEKLLASDSVAGLAFDVALHAGTLLSLIVFFWRDLLRLASGFFRGGEAARPAWLILLATLPAVIAGVLLESYAGTTFRAMAVVGTSLVVVGLLMLYAERLYSAGKNKTSVSNLSWRQAALIGAAQAAAIIPGVSRSGSTITIGMLAGLKRQAALRFSFLMAVPVIAGAIIKTFADKTSLEAASSQPAVFLLGTVAAFVSGMVAIKFMLGYLNKHGLGYFAWYRIVLGLVVLTVAIN